MNRLAAAARRGVQVILLYDHVGSFSLPRIYPPLNNLVAAGGQVRVFHPIIGRFRPFWEWEWPLFRFDLNKKSPSDLPFSSTHRKLLILDGQIAFVGGINMHADYAGPDVGGNGRFRDSHCRVKGSAAQQFAEVFLDSVDMTDPDLRASIHQKPHAVAPETGAEQAGEGPGRVLVQVLESNRRLCAIQTVFFTFFLPSASESVDRCSTH